MVEVMQVPLLCMLQVSKGGRDGRRPLLEQCSGNTGSSLQKDYICIHCTLPPSPPAHTKLTYGRGWGLTKSLYNVPFCRVLLAYLAALLPGGESNPWRCSDSGSSSFKLQNCLTAGTSQPFERETSKLSDLPGSHVICISFVLSISRKRWEFECIGEWLCEQSRVYESGGRSCYFRAMWNEQCNLQT